MADFNLDSCIMFTTDRISKLCSENLDKRLRLQGVNKNTWISMYFLNRYGRITQARLAKLVGIKQSSMAKIIEKLTIADLAVTVRDERDHRQKYIQLTAKGEEALGDSLPTVVEFQNDMTDGISQADLDTVQHVINRMIANAEKETE